MDYVNSMFSLKGNIALVTGGSYGIGFAIAKALARAGAVIAFNCRSQEHLDQAMKDYSKRKINQCIEKAPDLCYPFFISLRL